MPAVNLLSQSEFDRRAARRLRHRFLAGGVVMLLLVAGAWTVQHMRVAEAEKLVAVEQAETSRLVGETQVLAPVRAFVTGVAQQEQTVGTAMSDEIYFSEVLDGVRDATPAGADLATLSITLVPQTDATEAADGAAAVNPCPGPDPFNTRVVVGCVQLTGTASSRAEVGEMVVALGESGLFVEPFISTTTTDEADLLSFSGSVGLSEKVYSGRYAE
ncbi:hypothetical protein JCM10369A_29620 [Nocardioides pyridinolyticus]